MDTIIYYYYYFELQKASSTGGKYTTSCVFRPKSETKTPDETLSAVSAPTLKMVLSNTKLKQKLRAELAEKTAKSESQISAGDATTNSEPQQSLKQLLDSASQRPRLSKRERRRTVRISEHPEEAKESSDGGGAKEKKVEAATVKNRSEGLGKKKKDKKRKREVEPGNGVVEDAKKSQKKDKKKKKKKKNPKKKEPKTEAGNSTDAGGKVTGCGGNVTEVTELSKSSSR